MCRKAKRAERLAILRKIDELNKQLCGNCGRRYKCNCAAAVEIRRLGELLITDEEPQATLTVEVYHELKAQKMTDKSIRERFGMDNNKFYAWKRRKGLVNSQTVSRKTEPPRKPQQAVQQAERDESMKHSQEELEAVKRKLQALETDCETLKLKYNSTATDLENAKAELIESENARASLDSELNELERKYAKLVEENASLQAKNAEQQVWKLQDINERLHGDLETQQAEYYKLSNDYRDLHGENERLKRMLGRLKNTERMNLWMMEQYVDMHKQVDEVMG